MDCGGPFAEKNNSLICGTYRAGYWRFVRWIFLCEIHTPPNHEDRGLQTPFGFQSLRSE